MFDAVAMDGPPPPQRKGARVSERFQRLRVPALPTILFADANEDYRSMARDALLEGRNATDLRTVADATELVAYLKRAGAPEGGRGRVRRRCEHVHRQAGHVPRARAADEGLHRVLAGDRRALTMAAAQP